MTPTVVLVITGIIGLYMAWNIGANDVANAMGTSVGSGALTLKQAIVVAGLLEFCGAVLVGAYVTDTVRKGIVDPVIFASDPNTLIYGMMGALASAALWLNLSSYFGWPVSTTHSIVGAVSGFGILIGGFSAIKWWTMFKIVSSWVVSPVVGGLTGYIVYQVIRKTVIAKDDPGAAARKQFFLWTGLLMFVVSLVTLFKGLKNLKLKLSSLQALALSSGLGVLGMIIGKVLAPRTKWGKDGGEGGLKAMESTFTSLQVVTAATVAFAHGANDVANAVGPMAAVIGTVRSGAVAQKVDVPIWILLLGGAGIVVGLATYGYKVMATIGQKITEITPSRGFAAEFGAAITILLGSKLGLPLSTTHTLVGSVLGVGFARGFRALNMKVVRSIAFSWILTIPAAAGVCIVFFYIFRFIGIVAV
jgi:inorganic phosphate transporter, PiT family